jgi:hypothetical protein
VRRQLLISDLDRVVDGERHMWGKRKAKLDPTSPKWRAGVTMGIDFAYDVPMRMPDPNMPPGAIIGSPEKAREVAETSSDLFEFWTGLYEPRIRPRNASAGSFRYERPAFNYDRTLFTDLLQYAPGLHTTYADILATLESEAEIESATVGVIDPAARALIERSRAAGWSSLAIAGQGPIPPYKIAYNGLGQFTYERVLAVGCASRSSMTARRCGTCIPRSAWRRSGR